MPTAVARSTYQKLVDDISRLYETARRSQVLFAWETGKRIIEVEQQGKIRAEYGTGLIAKLSVDLTKKYGGGFSERNLQRMRSYYLAKPLPPLVRPTDLRLNTFKLAKPEVAALRKVPRGKILVDCGFFVTPNGEGYEKDKFFPADGRGIPSLHGPAGRQSKVVALIK